MTQLASDSDRQALHDIRERLEAAENSGDAACIGGIMAEDVVIMVPNEPVKEGRATCAGFIRDMLDYLHARFVRRISYTSDEVAVHGDLAFDRGCFAFDVRGREDGTTRHVTGKYFWVYSRDLTEGWRLSRLVASLDDEGEEAGESGEC